MSTDKRFSKILKDPRFKMPRRFRKVKIDSRFKSMFSDDKFKAKYSTDKRGRPIKRTSKEDLEKFYEIDEDNENQDKTTPNDETGNFQTDPARKQIQLSIKESALDESDSDSSDNDDDEIDFSDIRGGVQSSSSDDEEESDGIEDEDIEHDWGELDKDASRKPDAVTSRLAACNLDWDRVTANDLYVLFSSFGGAVKSVRVFLSEFGKERLAEEDLNGPIELREADEDEENEEDQNNVEGSTFHMEKLRKYQLNRLKYYYAIVDCDSKETANRIYDECDAIEYELSATRLDLRFVPEDMEFDELPSQIATEVPLLNNYQPTKFNNTALQQSTVRLTWDETDQKRLDLTMRQFNKEELMDMDFKAYLASSSEDEGENEEKENVSNEPEEVEEGEDEVDEKMKKYRALLNEIESKEKKDDEEQHMEISWAPALSEATEEIVKNKIEKEQEKGMTPWEKYKSDKKKKAKMNKRADKMLENSDSKDAKEEASEEEEYVPTGADDPFFVHSDDESDKKTATKNKRKNKKTKKKENLDETEDTKNRHEKNDLELLLMDENEEKQHFNMKTIIENETNKKKRKRGKQKETETTVDNFEVDVSDSRFDALFNSADYILDPSDPQFKKTKAMEKIIEEKQKRRERGLEKRKDDSNKVSATKQQKLNPSLSALVKNVKARTEEFQQRKTPKAKLKN